MLLIIIARVLEFGNSRQTSHGALLSSYHRTSLSAEKQEVPGRRQPKTNLSDAVHVPTTQKLRP
jgi:hypothetical protein